MVTGIISLVGRRRGGGEKRTVSLTPYKNLLFQSGRAAFLFIRLFPACTCSCDISVKPQPKERPRHAPPTFVNPDVKERVAANCARIARPLEGNCTDTSNGTKIPQEKKSSPLETGAKGGKAVGTRPKQRSATTTANSLSRSTCNYSGTTYNAAVQEYKGGFIGGSCLIADPLRLTRINWLVSCNLLCFWCGPRWVRGQR